MLPWLAESVDAHVILGEPGPLVDRLIEHGSSVEVLPMREAARDLRKDSVRPGLRSLRAVPATAVYVLRLALRLRRLRPDVVHANSLKSGVYGGLAARLAGVPMVWHVRDMIDRDYLPRSAVALLRVGIPRLSKAVVTNSDSTLRALGPRRSGLHYCVVHEVVDVATRVRHSQSDPDALRIGIVGRLAPWKGQEVFLDAFALAFPEGRHRAVIVGAALFGEDSYARSLDARAAALGIGDRVEFRGFREDVMTELAEFDILVHASISPEPFGKVILEGLAAGLPVLAADGGGPSEIITDGVDGLLYPSGDTVALAALLGELATDVDRRSALACAGRRRADDFDPATMATQITGVYQAVMREPSAASRPRFRRSAAR
jgi:glycosyltransferase involved in cell wall biosynthesis